MDRALIDRTARAAYRCVEGRKYSSAEDPYSLRSAAALSARRVRQCGHLSSYVQAAPRDRANFLGSLKLSISVLSSRFWSIRLYGHTLQTCVLL